MFRDREEAGRTLAEKLSHYRNDPTGLILALPRGGVAVGYQLSLALHIPMDVFITRKIGAPGNPEYAIGAIAETGARSLSQEAIGSFDLSRHELERLIHAQEKEIARRRDLYRRDGRFRNSQAAPCSSLTTASPQVRLSWPRPLPFAAYNLAVWWGSFRSGPHRQCGKSEHMWTNWCSSRRRTRSTPWGISS